MPTVTSLSEQLQRLQYECTKLGFAEAFAWLGRQIALLETAGRKRRKRGRWVTLAKTGERVMLDEAVVREAEREL